MVDWSIYKLVNMGTSQRDRDQLENGRSRVAVISNNYLRSGLVKAVSQYVI